jgi:hypothetical protein
MAQAPLIKLAPQLNFMWDELQGPESRTMRMFEANPNMGPGQYASLFEKMYERAGGAGDEIAQKYAQDVYSAMQDPAKAEALPPNAKFAYGYLTQKGMTPQQAAGITGRLMVESYPTMDPNARNTMGGGAGTLGVAQWRGPRLEALAKSAGVSMDDIRALPSSTPEGNYYSQTGSGGEKMAGGLLNMMPGATPDQVQVQEQAQPQRGGGLKGFLTNPDFLDTLAIGLGGMTMNPNVGVIEAAQSRMKNRAASRQDAQIRNKTAAWLRDVVRREDLASAVESGAIDGSAAVTLAYREPKDPVKGVSVGDRVVNPITGEVIYEPAGGLAFDAEKVQLARKEFTALPQVKSFADQTTAYGRVMSSISDPSPAGDLALIFNYMKVLDPGSVVREGEFATAQNAGSVDDRTRGLYNRIMSGERLSERQRADFADRATRLYGGAEQQYMSIAEQYGSFAQAAGLPADQVIPDYGFVGNRFQTPLIYQLPPTPPGVTKQDWELSWQNMTDAQRQTFLNTPTTP